MKHPVRSDFDTAVTEAGVSAYDRKLIQMGLIEQVRDEPPTWRNTALGNELDVDLFQVFMGL